MKSGYLLAPITEPNFSFPEVVADQSPVFRTEKVHDTDWYKFHFRSEDLQLSDTVNSTDEFDVLVRWGGENFIFAADQKEVAEYFRNHVFPKRAVPLLPQVVLVDEFVRSIADDAGAYSLSYLHARVYAWGSSLRSLTLYGDDLTNSGLVLDNLKAFNFYTCGIAKASSGREVLKISNNGNISFVVSKTSHYNEVDSTLRYLKSNDFYGKGTR